MNCCTNLAGSLGCIEERAMLLSYLKTLEQDAYTLAIQSAFYGIFRVGEIKGLTWDTKNENIITIKQQLVEERTLQSYTIPPIFSPNPEMSLQLRYLDLLFQQSLPSPSTPYLLFRNYFHPYMHRISPYVA